MGWARTGSEGKEPAPQGVRAGGERLKLVSVGVECLQAANGALLNACCENNA